MYSGYYGLIPTKRVDAKSNPIHSIIALIADYDAVITEDDFQHMLERSKNHPPNWAHVTPSGGARLIWTLSKPVLVTSHEVLQKVLRMASKSLDLPGLLPGFDLTNAFLNTNIYYDVGRHWMEVEGAKPIKASLVEGWMVKASSGIKWVGQEIPLELVASKVQEQFPGRWDGPFEIGARGVRFWDPMADNPTAAIVRPTGMQCFTGPSGFVSWSKIFGSQWVEQQGESRLGEAVDEIWYDGKVYWYQSADEKWEARSERETTRFFKVSRGMSSEAIPDRDYSEIDMALNAIDLNRRVIGAAPFVYRPSGMIKFMTKRILNTARVEALEPAESVDDWGDGFPWISHFLEKFFGDEEQLLRFICWLRRFYVSALRKKPLQGQAVFIAGEPGQGKTLLSNAIVSGLVGGHQDASQFLLGASSFNKELFHHGLWTVDDATPGDSITDHKKFSSLLKKVTANTTFEYHAKFQDSVMVEWTGRVIVTGNLDAESLRILPDLDTSILDKLMLFKAAKVDKNFPDRNKLVETIQSELPSFASYLVDFEIPYECRSAENRYGITSYHHPDLQHAAGETTDAAILDEVIGSFMAERVRNREEIPWKGTALDLMQEILLDEILRNIVGKYSPKWFSVQLGKLEAQNRRVTSARVGTRKIYTIFPNSDS